MLFNSYEFIFLFLPVTLAVYFLLSRWRLTVASNAWLLAASLVFYSRWDLRYLPLILGSILFNYTVGFLLVQPESASRHAVARRSVFWFGVGGNLFLLCYFKYLDFFVANLNTLPGVNLPLLRIVLPLGISFFTITQIAFLVDCYEGLVQDRNLLSYALFVTFFPHLLAGPILHHKEMMPQFEALRSKLPVYRNLAAGLFIFFLGLFKKVVIADQFSATVKLGFDAAQRLNLVESWVASLSYSLQLYYDFSGYSDMALGAGLLFNIVLPVNFNSPYKAANIIDFWQRWHMSLTRFITTYLYSPIIRSFRRVTFGKSMLATFLAMLIAGIWHGAGWTFVVWGALHGAALVVNHRWRKRKLKLPRWAGWLVTFNFVNVSFVFFRAKSLPDALGLLQGMAGFHGILPATLGPVSLASLGQGRFWKFLLANLNGNDGTLWTLVGVLVLTVCAKNTVELKERFRPTWWSLAALSVVSLYALASMNRISEFLYFQF